MSKTEKQYLQELFHRLNKSWNLRKEVSAFGKFFKKPVWLIMPLVHGTKLSLTKADVTKHVKAQTGRGWAAKDINKLFAAIKTSRSRKRLELFSYGRGMYGMCYPFKSEGKIFGFIILCGLRKKVTSSLQAIFQSFTDTIISEIRKEAELEELNETIRPRAIALSTVHTVHRLMSYTPSLSELLPRIARLSLQVLRANRCSIKLVDKKRKVLLPKTTVDLRKAKTKLKKVKIGKYAPGRAVKQGRTIRGKNYLSTPLIEDEVLGVITLYDKLDGSPFTSFDEEIMKTLAEQAVIAIRNAQLFEEQENLTMGSIKCIAMLLQTRPHGVQRADASFLKLINIMGRKFNMNESEIKMMQYAAMLHDTGKISIPEKLLMKKGGLTGSEFTIVKSHTLKGASILSKIKPLKPIVPIILYHHENYNGTGYPKGLKAQDIPLPARILAVVSAFEAMMTKKPYRKALSIPAAIKEVRKNSGSQFDPQVVKVFCDAAARKNVVKLLKKELK